MYNATPMEQQKSHHLSYFLNRSIRDKIPTVTDLMGENDDEVVKDNDILNKHKGKMMEDVAREAKYINIKPEDEGLVENLVLPHKFTTIFGKERRERI